MKNGMDSFYATVVRKGIYTSESALEYHLNFIFQGVDFTGKRMLEIGGGAGVYSFYAASRGAKEVVCLEPEGAGSSASISELFDNFRKELKLDQVVRLGLTFQEYEPQGRLFDIVLLYNSINHLDEWACEHLNEEEKAERMYGELAEKMRGMMVSGGMLILCDCSRYNFFAEIGIRNPLARQIEWKKHQPPERWADLLGEAGFINPCIRWTSCKRLKGLGSIFLGHKAVSYFLTSHFCLGMEAG